ncbi:MAG TPA: glycoside hydrolase family 43 protein [Rectinemataceae bacterium]|nr:glycoside hydrolase family 43 protein [Rectinemataceae bacterium]
MIRSPHLRDPFVLARPAEGGYYLFGSTDEDIWRGPGRGFDAYVGADLESWEGPYPVFRPEPDFWGKRNFWAPEVHEYRGAFYMFASFMAEGRRRATQILRAEEPTGPYRVHSPEPVTPPEWECLDGTFFLDAAGDPWIVFCHEWVQIVDGEICAQRLAPDLTKAMGEPELLFRASEAAWSRPPRRKDGSMNPLSRVTDGPFVHKLASGGLVMLWSSIAEKGYAMGWAFSKDGILGPWIQSEEPIIDADGGHGMLFRDFEGALCLTYHSPNDTPNERFRYRRVVETGNGLALADGR